MTNIIINPGTEPVEDATLENAERAMSAFVRELNEATGLTLTYERHGVGGNEDHGGRFAFTLYDEWDPTIAAIRIDMPGCDPAITMSSTPWVSPRMYVDGDSWLWTFAVRVTRRELMGEDDD